MAAIKIKSTHPESQGAFVNIEEENFDPSVHELFEPVAADADADGGDAEPAKPAKRKSK